MIANPFAGALRAILVAFACIALLAPAQAQQPCHQGLRRIKGRAGKRAETGDEDAEFLGHFSPVSPRSAPPPAPA